MHCPRLFVSSWKRVLCTTVAITLAAAFNLATAADLQLPNIFSDNMVLQRDHENPVWGRCDAGAEVMVSIASQAKKATADANGDWKVVLDPMSVTTDPQTLTVTCGEQSVSRKNILVGEVWICSGQSNMRWTLQRSSNADIESLTANYPNLRLITYPNVGRQEPVWSHENVQWVECTPETALPFSAVGYFFGRQLHETLDVPVGLINNAWGGSAAEAWVRRDAMEGNEEFQPILDRYAAMAQQYEKLKEVENPTKEQRQQMNRLRGRISGNQNPSNIYNGVLKSHISYGIRGAIWYQGESNSSRAYQYRNLFPLMISEWRKEWGQGDFPFYWVQLADFRAERSEPSESDWAELREAQTMTLDRLPNTGQAVIIDVGEGKDIHPQNKLAVGQRLARLALHHDYGINIAADSPRLKSSEIGEGFVDLVFDHIPTGWRTFDVKEPIGFTIAGDDKKFYEAQAVIQKNNSVRVSSPSVVKPASVRYGWADNPVLNM
ncbi:MAG: sialate O-acetylesterase, partial [Planctomycetota bacterium]